MSRHGRAVLPFGKYRGVRLRLIPDDYLSWLTTAPMMKDDQWRWLWDSLIAELKWRGLRYDLAHTEEPVVEPALPVESHRKFRFVVEPEVQELDFS
jgi:uncharacterized protein (DUF3820 family)